MYVGYAEIKPSLLWNNIELAVVVEVKDHGIIVDFHLNFDVHICQTVALAFVRANLMHNCFVSHDIITLSRAFNVYVKPIV